MKQQAIQRIQKWYYTAVKLWFKWLPK